MDVEFTHTPGGIIEASVGPAFSLLTQALNDTVSSRAPRGAVRPGLSTYWIDCAERGALDAAAEARETQFASGNVTYLRLVGDRVIAAFDFDSDETEAESVSLSDFLSILEAWRERVIDAGGVSGDEAAELAQERPPRPMGGGA